jgi:lysozyme family protein
MTFDEAFNILLLHEGGYSNHAADPGGATRYGVTEAVARQEGYTGDMRAYPLSEARRVYRKRYWEAMRLDELPAEVRFDLFDAAVNSGVGQTTKWAQRILALKDDGIIGPVTLQAITTCNRQKFLAKFNGQRLLFMTSLSGWPSFGRGWARRIAENLMR